MAKRKKERAQVTPAAQATPLKHNPFANALAHLAPEVAEAPDDTPEAAAPTSAPTPTPAEVTPARAVVRLERKGRGGKQVTTISHLELSDDARATWCANLRKHLGCGGSVEGELIIVQGDHRDRARAWLEAQGVRRVTLG